MFLKWAHIRANTTSAVIGLTKEKITAMYIVQVAMACSRHVSLTISRSLEYPEQVCGIGLCIWWPIRAGFQNVDSARLAGSSHHDCEQVVWRVEAGRAEAGQSRSRAGRALWLGFRLISILGR